jgi:transcriptional regulator with XRE-family HTH domain
MVESSYMSKSKTPGEILKEARLKKGWTQDELAKKAGLGKNTYPKIERDISLPQPDTAISLIEALGLPMSLLPQLVRKR